MEYSSLPITLQEAKVIYSPDGRLQVISETYNVDETMSFVTFKEWSHYEQTDTDYYCIYAKEDHFLQIHETNEGLIVDVWKSDDIIESHSICWADYGEE